MSQLERNSVDVIFADPPYNIKKADWDSFDSLNQYLDWTERWVDEAHRLLKNNGTLFIMGFSEILAHIQVRVESKFKQCRWLIWYYRNKPNLGQTDWTRSHEAILHLRKSEHFTFNIDQIREPYNKHTIKYPERSQGESSQYGKANSARQRWSPNPRGAKPRDVIEIPALNNAMQESTGHPTQKPEALLRKLILAVSNENDLVLDPFGGSGTTYAVCEQLRRRWLGSEINPHYCEMIKKRLEKMPHRSPEYWLQLDLQRQMHRQKVRHGSVVMPLDFGEES
jgi:site-specific DNA-methyltransferase (adenine-specific)